MELTKYQWFQEQPASECGFCDRLLKQGNTGEIGDTIQIKLSSQQIYIEQFNGNPFDEITSADLTFKLTFPIPGVVSWQFYFETKTYITIWSIQTNDYELLYQDGNVYVYGIKLDLFSAANSRASFLAFLNAIIDVEHLTTSSMDGGTFLFTIADVPTGSYLNDSYGALNTISTVTSGNIGKSLYWTGGSICYYGSGAQYQFSVSLGLGVHNIKIPYTVTSSNLTYSVTITDGITPMTVTGSLNNPTGTISFNYDSISSDSYDVTITITDVDNVGGGLCFDNIEITKISLVDKIEIEGCDATITEIDYQVDYYGDCAVIHIDTGAYDIPNYPDAFRFIITDTDEDTIVSRWYELYDSTNCEHQKYTKITWSNSCNLGELLYDYSLLNELYFSGVLIKQGLEIHDSADNVTADGRKISIFKITQPSYELRLAPYLSETMDMIERIFEHDTVLINGVQYNTTDSFQVSELDMGVYTGRVDLLKSDDSLVSVKCCS